MALYVVQNPEEVFYTELTTEQAKSLSGSLPDKYDGLAFTLNLAQEAATSGKEPVYLLVKIV